MTTEQRIWLGTFAAIGTAIACFIAQDCYNGALMVREARAERTEPWSTEKYDRHACDIIQPPDR